MIIEATNLCKHYNSKPVFQNFSYTFNEKRFYAIIGKNGSGKSTLIKILSSILVPSKGRIKFYRLSKEVISKENVYKHIHFVAPYSELIEEMSGKEIVSYFSKFKQAVVPFTADELFETLKLNITSNQKIHTFSSGMKQRLKLGLAFWFKSDIIFLDESCNHLDSEGKQEVYQNLVNNDPLKRKLIISSNNKEEYHFAEKIINIEAYSS